LFRPLVHALGRSTGGAMLPSVGLCLNASKAESALDRRWRRYIWESRVPKGEYSLCDYARRLFLTVSRRVVPRRVLCRNGCDQGLKHLKLRPPACSRPRVFRSRDSESFVDDLRTWRGVVSGRAVITLRSVKTLPSAWEIRECGFTSLPPCLRARRSYRQETPASLFSPPLFKGEEEYGAVPSHMIAFATAQAARRLCESASRLDAFGSCIALLAGRRALVL